LLSDPDVSLAPRDGDQHRGIEGLDWGRIRAARFWGTLGDKLPFWVASTGKFAQPFKTPLRSYTHRFEDDRFGPAVVSVRFNEWFD